MFDENEKHIANINTIKLIKTIQQFLYCFSTKENIKNIISLTKGNIMINIIKILE
jgi:hypothetical protein